jgi:hypothetical protein
MLKNLKEMQFADNLTAYMETAGDSICNKEVM